MMDNDLLLPCPFCGGRAVSDVSDRGFVSVECGECSTRGPSFKSLDNDYESARRHWNTRSAGDLVCEIVNRRAPGAPLGHTYTVSFFAGGLGFPDGTKLYAASRPKEKFYSE